MVHIKKKSLKKKEIQIHMELLYMIKLAFQNSRGS